MFITPTAVANTGFLRLGGTQQPIIWPPTDPPNRMKIRKKIGPPILTEFIGYLIPESFSLY